jgi:hypothetical protein
MNIPLPGWSRGSFAKTDSMANLFHNGRKEGLILTFVIRNNNAGMAFNYSHMPGKRL